MGFKLRSVAFAAAMLGTLAVTSGARAGLSNVVFEFTYAPYSFGPQELILNGSVVLTATNTGWYDNTGFHDGTNPDYIVGTCGSSDACNGNDDNYRDYFVFDLSGVTGPITSAELSLGNPGPQLGIPGGFLSIKPLTYTNFDVTTPITTLIASSTGAVDVYDDLGTGVTYGSTVVTSAANGTTPIGTQVEVTLDADAIAAIEAAEGSQFAIGGSVTSAVPTIPEPSALALLGAALLGLGLARRRRAN